MTNAVSELAVTATKETHNLVVSARLNIVLLEDLHIGSGMGGGDIDSLQHRDRHGNPAIAWSHLKGLMRDCHERYSQRLGSVGRSVNTNRLFGRAGGQEGAVMVGSGWLQTPAGRPAAVLSTVVSSGRGDPTSADAKRREARSPRHDSLHFVEYVAAGSTFVAKIEHLAGDTEEIKSILSMLSHLGSGKSRGDGVVFIEYEPAGSPELESDRFCKFDTGAATQEAAGIADSVNDGSAVSKYSIRCIWQSEDLLSFPKDSGATNILNTEHFLPSSVLTGAIVNRLLNESREPEQKENFDAERLVDDLLAGHHLVCLPGYAVPASVTLDRLLAGQAHSYPAPISFSRAKSIAPSTGYPAFAESRVHEAVPVKGEKREAGPVASPSAEPFGNRLSADAPQGGKSLSQSACVFDSGDPDSVPVIFNPSMSTRLRIEVPDAENAGTQSLFSSEELAEDTLFISEIHTSDLNTANALVEALSVLAQRCFRVGRGKRPLRLHAARCTAVPNVDSSLQRDAIYLVAVDDVVIRGPNFGFFTALDRNVLQHLLAGLPGGSSESTPNLTAFEVRDMSQSGSVGGFNIASGLPRARQLAIKRGSVCRISAFGDQATDNRSLGDLCNVLVQVLPSTIQLMDDPRLFPDMVSSTAAIISSDNTSSEEDIGASTPATNSHPAIQAEEPATCQWALTELACDAALARGQLQWKKKVPEPWRVLKNANRTQLQALRQCASILNRASFDTQFEHRMQRIATLTQQNFSCTEYPSPAQLDYLVRWAMVLNAKGVS